MKINNKIISFLGAVYKEPKICSLSRKYLFIFSHMRSNSTLLAHILGSNPEISGHVEMHQSYSNLLDFYKLNYKIQKFESLDVRYLLDKILHDSWQVSDTLLSNSKKVKIIFLLREPDITIKSIINMWEKNKNISESRNHLMEKAFHHYLQRIKKIEVYVSKVSNNSFYIPSSKLIRDSNLVLSTLSEWLDLQEPLSESYKIFDNTGFPGCGDPSMAIRSGKILQSGDQKYDDIKLDGDMSRKANLSFARCQDMLLKKCHTIE